WRTPSASSTSTSSGPCWPPSTSPCGPRTRRSTQPSSGRTSTGCWGDNPMADSYRVIQWATGNIGSRSLRAVIEHPAMTLAGVYVHSAEKAGRDAGDLCGVGPTGVVATTDVDEIVTLGADCVLYMPRWCDMDVVCLLLESGANIVTTRGEFHRPAGMDPAI